MMKKTAKQYTAEEKAKIAVEGLKGELSIAQISSKYGVHATQITKWKQYALEAMIAGFKDKRKGKDPGEGMVVPFVSLTNLTWIPKKLDYSGMRVTMVGWKDTLNMMY